MNTLAKVYKHLVCSSDYEYDNDRCLARNKLLKLGLVFNDRKPLNYYFTETPYLLKQWRDDVTSSEYPDGGFYEHVYDQFPNTFLHLCGNVSNRLYDYV